jgi:isoleucyl-tRNA synthetase
LTLYNSIEFFNTYTFPKDWPKKEIIPRTKNILDLWVISRLNNLIEKTTKNLDDFNAMSATLAIEDFFINDLSLWYIRRSRKRFHPAPERSSVRSKKTRKEAIETLYYVLLNLIKLVSPIMPFFAEENYQTLRQNDMPESVHLLDWPKANKKLINKKLEDKMIKVREVVALALAERAKAGIKVRQPLNELRITNYELRREKELLELIKEEVNVKKITFGKTLKLDTKITPELKEEGIIREVIRQIQAMRKKAGLKPKDKISVQCFGTPELNKILEKNKKIILTETKAKDFLLKEKVKQTFLREEELKIGQQKLWLAIKKL